MSILFAKVKLWWHLLTVNTTTPSNNTPTVMAPAELDRDIPAPPRIPFEFGLFVRHNAAPAADPLREECPLRKHATPPWGRY
jgi:hypothetical protein